MLPLAAVRPIRIEYRFIDPREYGKTSFAEGLDGNSISFCAFLLRVYKREHLFAEIIQGWRLLFTSRFEEYDKGH